MLKNIILTTIIVAIIASFAKTSYAITAPPSDMVGYWRMDEKSGSKVSDTSGNNSGTLMNGPVWTSGKIRGALSFDGVDDYIDVGTNSSLAMSSSFTISLWLKRAVDDTNAQILVSRRVQTGAGNNNYFFTLNPLGNKALRMGFYDGTSWQNVTSNANVITDTNWHHATGVYNDANDTIEIFVDGVSIGSGVMTTSGSTGGTQYLYIGTDPKSQNRYFNGFIDNLRIYNRALTSQEVKNIYDFENAPLSVPDYTTSKLSSIILWGDRTNTDRILNSCPKVVTWVTPYPKVAKEITNYKKRCPEGVVVVRVYVPSSTKYSISDDPISSADDFWLKMKAGGYGLSFIDKNSIDWLEGPNELNNIPNWYNDLNSANWFALFWSELADLMNADGYNPLVGSLVTGQPLLQGELYSGSPNLFQPLADVMKTKSYKWGWSYHAYTLTASKDLTDENKYALHYRKILNETNLNGIPLVFTEGGYHIPEPYNLGWQEALTNEEYVDWLAWFDEEMKKDEDVIGLTIFQIGSSDSAWSSYDIAPIIDKLFGPPLPISLKADLNSDGTVNSLDWSIMNSAWGTADTTADINNDGIVNTIDFSILNGEWGM